jgi:hypothetical protein
VRGHQKRAGVGLEELLEPDDRLDVEVVGRLIHQQHVGPAEQHPRQRDAHFPAARELPNVAIDLVILEAEAVQNLAGLRFERIAAEMVVLLLHLAEARENAVHVVRALVIFHGALEVLELVMQIADAAAAGDGLVEHRPARHLLHILAEIADGQALGNRDLTLVGSFLADDHAKQGGLAGAVGADQADLVAGIQLKGGVNEDQLFAVLLVDIREGDQTPS